MHLRKMAKAEENSSLWQRLIFGSPMRWFETQVQVMARSWMALLQGQQLTCLLV